MTTQNKTLAPGSYSHATHRARHLIPVFISALESVSKDEADGLRVEYAAVFNALEHDIDPEGTDDCDYLMEALFDALDAHCPENHYFGAHPGDGSDFGVWQCEDVEDDETEETTEDDEQTDEDRADGEAYVDMRNELESGECATINEKDEVFFCGKLLGRFPDRDEAFVAIREAMDKAQYWPNIYSVNDHGNVTLHDKQGNHIRDWV